MVTKGKWGKMNLEFGSNTHTTLYEKDKQGLTASSTGSYAQNLVIT